MSPFEHGEVFVLNDGGEVKEKIYLFISNFVRTFAGKFQFLK